MHVPTSALLIELRQRQLIAQGARHALDNANDGFIIQAKVNGLSASGANGIQDSIDLRAQAHPCVNFAAIDSMYVKRTLDKDIPNKSDFHAMYYSTLEGDPRAFWPADPADT